jgi:cytochrome c oxidase assembly protein subunit 15
MVKSGLTLNPDVSPYRLTAHLGLAVLIYGYTFLTAISLIRPRSNFVYTRPKNHLRLIITLLTGLTFLTILSGGLVAGNDAGLAYNSFPLMDGKILPEGVLSLDPWWSNYFENTVLVQLNHRLLAILVVILTLITWLISFKYSVERGTRRALNVWAISVLVQLSLGISTLLLFVPVHLAAAHQTGAIIVFTAALWSASKVWGKDFK